MSTKKKHDSNMGCRKIAHWLNNNGYITPRENEFKNTHVISILERKGIRDGRMLYWRNLKIEKFRLILLKTLIQFED